MTGAEIAAVGCGGPCAEPQLASEAASYPLLTPLLAAGE